MKKQLLDKDCIALFEKAMKYELFHEQMYRHLATQMQGVGYFGAQKYFLEESKEEAQHYLNHVNFLNDYGVVVPTPPVPTIKETFDTLEGALKYAFEQEFDLLEYYREFAKDEGLEYADILDHLLGYAKTQREAVGFYGDMLARLSLVGDAAGILLIDQELGNK